MRFPHCGAIGFRISMSPFTPRARTYIDSGHAVSPTIEQCRLALTFPGKRSEAVIDTSMPRGPRPLRPQHSWLSAGERSQHVDAVAPQVHQRCAGQLEVVAHVVGRDGDAEHRLELGERRDRASEFEHALGHRVIAPVERLHDQLAARRRSSHHLRSLLGVGRQRLLAKYVFPDCTAAIAHSAWSELASGT